MAILAAPVSVMGQESEPQAAVIPDNLLIVMPVDEHAEVITPLPSESVETLLPVIEQENALEPVAIPAEIEPISLSSEKEIQVAPDVLEPDDLPGQEALDVRSERLILDEQIVEAGSQQLWDLHALTSFQLIKAEASSPVVTEAGEEFWLVVDQAANQQDEFALKDDQVLKNAEAEQEKALFDAIDAALWQKEVVQEEPELDMSLLYLQAEQRRQRKHWLERGHDVVSRFVKGVGRSTDRFLSRRFDVDNNETYLRVRVAQVFERGGEMYWQQDIKAKMDLPTTRDKLQLLFDNDPDDIYTLPNQHNPVERARDGKQAVDENSTAALRWVAPVWHSWRPSIDVGVRAKIPLDSFVRVRFRRDFDFTKNWDLRVGQQFSYLHSRAAGSDTDFTFVRFVTPEVLISNGVDIRWRGKTDLLEYAFISSITYMPTDADTLMWQVGAFYEQEPDPHWDSYMAGFTYRRKIYWDWLHAEFTPGIVWKEKYDFRDDHSFTARLEVVF